MLEFIKAVAAYRGANYPERASHIFIINAPVWFGTLWAMISPFIDPKVTALSTALATALSTALLALVISAVNATSAMNASNDALTRPLSAHPLPSSARPQTKSKTHIIAKNLWGVCCFDQLHECVHH